MNFLYFFFFTLFLFFTDSIADEFDCASVVSVSAKADATGFATAHGKLSVSNNKIVDKNGEIVQLRGFSTHGLQWHFNCYTQDSVNFIVKNYGVTLFRVALYISEGGYATDNAGYLAKLEKLVQYAINAGIYVMIDWHVLNPGDPNYYLTGAGAATGNATTFWTTIARKYTGVPNVLYEICNEPNGVSWTNVLIYANSIIATIRAIDPDTIIIVGTPNWSQQLQFPAATPVTNKKNVMYTFHFYSGTHQSLESTVTTYANKIPIFSTEWGTSEASGDGGPYLKVAGEFLSIYNQFNISWAQWTYSDDPYVSSALVNGACSSGSWSSLTCSGKWSTNFLITAFNSATTTPSTTSNPTTASPTTATPTTGTPTSKAPTTKTPTTASSATAAPTVAAGSCVSEFQQCGGLNGNAVGNRCCDNAVCCIINSFYYQCLSEERCTAQGTGVSTFSPTARSPSQTSKPTLLPSPLPTTKTPTTIDSSNSTTSTSRPILDGWSAMIIGSTAAVILVSAAIAILISYSLLKKRSKTKEQSFFLSNNMKKNQI